MEEKSKKRLIDMIFSKLSEETLAGAFGGGEYGRNIAAMITKIKFDLPLDDLSKPSQAGTPAEAAADPAQSKSNQIKANQTCGDTGA